MMVDAFCPKHHIKYGGQVRPGEKIECPMCKTEKGQTLNKPVTPTPAPVSIHTPPPNPSRPNKPDNNQLPNYGSNFIR